MNEHLQQLEALRHHPALQVAPEQRSAIVGQILHHLMHPYFLKRTPEMQGKFGEAQYQAFMQAMAGYCLREYIENPEPRLSIEFIKGLHRQFYGSAPSVPVKAVDGTMTTMVPGEFKTVPVYVRLGSEWVATPSTENVQYDMEQLLGVLHEQSLPMFLRYMQFMLEFTVFHPFPDNNGKVVMLLGDLFLLKQGIHPPFFSKCKWWQEQKLMTLLLRYKQDGNRDISHFYPMIIDLYTELGLDIRSAR